MKGFLYSLLFNILCISAVSLIFNEPEFLHGIILGGILGVANVHIYRSFEE